LKTGDACVVGSENYADFREQLLTWEECEPQVESYCRELGIPSTADEFTQHLRFLATQVAEEVDKICSDGKQVIISQDGEPILKRIPPQAQPKGAAALFGSYSATPSRAQRPGYPLPC
jgi:antitoxin (DNA-binding transcriptional repressor) of toxin-antitoxin stability system